MYHRQRFAKCTDAYKISEDRLMLGNDCRQQSWFVGHDCLFQKRKACHLVIYATFSVYLMVVNINKVDLNANVFDLLYWIATCVTLILIILSKAVLKCKVP